MLLKLHLFRAVANLPGITKLNLPLLLLLLHFLFLQLLLPPMSTVASLGSCCCSSTKRRCASSKSPGLYAHVAITAHTADPRSSRKVKTYTLCAAAVAAAVAAAASSSAGTAVRDLGWNASAASSSSCMKRTRAFKQVNFQPEVYRQLTAFGRFYTVHPSKFWSSSSTSARGCSCCSIMAVEPKTLREGLKNARRVWTLYCRSYALASGSTP